ncbi:MAG: SOS response-associated peptidase family protein [Terriglobales bacterium]
MCGRVVQASDLLRYAFVDGLGAPDNPLKPHPVMPHRASLLCIRGNHDTGERTLKLLRWGPDPARLHRPDGGRKRINARAESVAQLPVFRRAGAKLGRARQTTEENLQEVGDAAHGVEKLGSRPHFSRRSQRVPERRAIRGLCG